MTRLHAGDDEMDELGTLLVRYADSALAPDPAAMDRIRREVRAEAQRLSVRRHAEALAMASVPATAAASRGRLGRWTMRKLTLALAASLVLGVSLGTTAFAASKAGAPLYELRVGLETITLPSDPEDRLAAQLERADWRLAEASQAAGDANAVQAALAMYTAIVGDAGSITAEDAAIDKADARIAHHETILQKLLGQVPAQAQDAVRKAQDKSDKAKKDLRLPPGQVDNPGQGPKKTDDPAATPNPGNGNGNGNPGGGNGNPGGGNGNGDGNGNPGGGNGNGDGNGGQGPPGQGNGGGNGNPGGGNGNETPEKTKKP